MRQIINSIGRYRGAGIPGLNGHRVVVIAVHRGEAILRDDFEIRRLQVGDRFEVAPIITESNGTERVSWITSDALPNELGPVEGVWNGVFELTMVM